MRVVYLEESSEEGDVVGPFDDGVEEAERAIDKRGVPLEGRVFQQLCRPIRLNQKENRGFGPSCVLFMNGRLEVRGGGKLVRRTGGRGTLAPTCQLGN